MEKPGIRWQKPEGKIKSYWFFTYTHSESTKIYTLFYPPNHHIQCIIPGLIREHADARTLAYWLMCDGSIQ